MLILNDVKCIMDYYWSTPPNSCCCQGTDTCDRLLFCLSISWLFIILSPMKIGKTGRYVLLFPHTHISASKLTHLWKTYENIWTHLKNCGLSPIFHPLPHHSNLLTAAVRLNVTSQVCRKSFRPLVFWWSSPFPAEGLMFDDVWLFDSNENMKTIKRQEPYEIIYIYKSVQWHFLTKGHKNS